MSHGLKIWDGSGNIVIDTTDRLSKLVNTIYFYINNSNSYTDISVAGINSSEYFSICSVGCFTEINSGFIRVRSDPITGAPIGGYLYIFRF